MRERPLDKAVGRGRTRPCRWGRVAPSPPAARSGRLLRPLPCALFAATRRQSPDAAAWQPLPDSGPACRLRPGPGPPVAFPPPAARLSSGLRAPPLRLTAVVFVAFVGRHQRRVQTVRRAAFVALRNRVLPQERQQQQQHKPAEELHGGADKERPAVPKVLDEDPAGSTGRADRIGSDRIGSASGCVASPTPQEVPPALPLGSGSGP